VPRVSRFRLTLVCAAARGAWRWHSERLAPTTVSQRMVPRLLSRGPVSVGQAARQTTADNSL
jgi:hypothetical protein